MHCLRCGREIAESATFCESCENAVSEPLVETAYLSKQIHLPTRRPQPPRPAQTKPARKPEEETKPRGRGAVAVLVALCLLLLAAGLYAGKLWLDGRTEIDAMKGTVAALEQEKAGLETTVDGLEGSVSSLQETVSSLQETVAGLEDSLAEKEEAAADLLKNNSKLQQTLRFVDQHVAFVPNDGSKYYHTGGCTQYNKNDFTVCAINTAVQQGYEPCPYCH